MEFLKDKERVETFRLTLSNTYETLQDLLDEGNMEVNPHWECLKKTWTSTCEEVLGKKKKRGNIRIGSLWKQLTNCK